MKLKGQSTISAKRGLPSELVNESFQLSSVSGESLQLKFNDSGVLTNDSGEAAGTLVIAALSKSSIRCSLGKFMGSFGDSSLSVTSAALTTEVAFTDTKKNLDDKSPLSRLSEIASYLQEGEFCVDYEKGILYGKKADSSTSISVSYSYPSSTESENDFVSTEAAGDDFEALDSSVKFVQLKVVNGSTPQYIQAWDAPNVAGISGQPKVLVYAGANETFSIGPEKPRTFVNGVVITSSNTPYSVSSGANFDFAEVEYKEV